MIGGGVAQGRTEGLRRRARLLETRIVAVALVSTLVALVLTFSIYQWRNWTADRENLAADQIFAGRSIARLAHRSLISGDPRTATEAEGLLRLAENAVGASYFHVDGRRVDLRRDALTAADLKPEGVREPVAHDRPGGMQIHVPHYVDGKRVGELVMRASDAALVRDRIDNVLIALGLSAIAMVGSALVARALVRRALRPLRELEEGIASVTHSRDFGASLEVATDDEVGRLTRNFNSLLAALKDYDASLHGALAEATAARDAAEEANHLKTRFLANMSHEIRTPLNGVLGMAQMMAMNDLSADQKGRLEVIQSSGGTLLSILNDVLDLSRLEAGEMCLEPEAFDLEEMARGALAVFQAAAETRGLGFELQVDESAKGAWMGDSGRLRQVLYHLISNALKFTAEGEVAVRIEEVEDGEGLSLSVADTGIGIAPEVLPKLFDRFVQAESGTTRRFGGVGLGLTLCRGIIDLMGGSISLETEVGQGTEVFVRLPMARVVALPAAMDDAAHDRPLKVLVAEDNETNQRVIRAILGALGLEPVVVENGRAAVDAWEDAGFDIVLMDIQMPEMDGVSAAREIRRLEAQRGAPATRILAVTANVMPDQVAEYLAAGMDGHVAKPVAIEKLLAAMTAASEAKAAA